MVSGFLDLSILWSVGGVAVAYLCGCYGTAEMRYAYACSTSASEVGVLDPDHEPVTCERN